MPPKTPHWWLKSQHPLSLVLMPVGALYDLATRARFKLAKPYRSNLPVICIGNFTVGGGGKTPLALLVGEMLLEQGRKPVFLTRGYGGRIKGPHLVDPNENTAVDVGDEALILARTAPVIVSADRAAGACFIERMDADVILMDDGFQNPGLFKDLSLVVVDEAVGIGNGRLFPAGPLRSRLSFQMPKAAALIFSGPAPGAGASVICGIEEAFEGPVYHVEIVPQGDTGWLRERPVLAVTGIARPGKFYDSLKRLGASLTATRDYPDHHMFTEQDALGLLDVAKQKQAHLVMTRKDWVRLPKTGRRGELRDLARVLDIELELDDRKRFREMLEKTISGSDRFPEAPDNA